MYALPKPSKHFVGSVTLIVISDMIARMGTGGYTGRLLLRQQFWISLRVDAQLAWDFAVSAVDVDVTLVMGFITLILKHCSLS